MIVQTSWKLTITCFPHHSSTLIFCSGFLWGLLSPRGSQLRVRASRECWAALCFVLRSQAPPEACWAVWRCHAHFPFQPHIFPINDEWERSGRVSLMACLRANNSLGKRLSDLLGIPVYSIIIGRNPKESEHIQVLKGPFPCGLGYAKSSYVNLGITLPVILVIGE